MEFQVKEAQDVVVITLTGEMVGGPDATALNDQVKELVKNGKNKVVINMKHVNWMNSSGLGILIGSVNTIRKSGGDLKLAHLNEKPRQVLEITKLDRVFGIFDQEEEAIASYSE